MPAAVAIPALIGAGTSIASGVMQHKAANAAEKAQTRAADRALSAENGAYQTQQGLYRGMMGGASNTLSRLLTPPASTRYAAPGVASQPFTGAPGMGARTVSLRAPDGSTADVPEHLADQFLARGAQRVGGGAFGRALTGRMAY